MKHNTLLKNRAMFFSKVLNHYISRMDMLIESVQASLRTLKRVQKMQPKLKLKELIEETEALVKAMKDPESTPEQIQAISERIETIKKKGWR